MSDRTLEGRTVAVLEGRQTEDLARLFEAEGATVLRCPLFSIVNTPDSGAVLAWLQDLAVGRFGAVIFLTGEGVRRLIGFAERAGNREAVVRALGETRTVTRGPKPVSALKEIGLAPTAVAASPTTAGVMATLKGWDLSGETVGVQLYGEANAELVAFLEGRGAAVRTVLPYAYAPAADSEEVKELVTRAAEGGVDVLVFTSSPQVDRLYEVIDGVNLHSAWQRACERTRIAAVGPIVADSLRRRGVRVDICPEQGFVMKNLVRKVCTSLKE